MEQTYITHSAQETQDLAKMLLKEKLSGPIFLVGDWGSGKTTFVKGLARALKIKKTVTSPSFLLCREYDIKNNQTLARLSHYDLYRLRSYNELAEIGFEERLLNNRVLVIIEWPNKIKNLVAKLKKFQKQPIIIKFYHTKDRNQRRIQIHY